MPAGRANVPRVVARSPTLPIQHRLRVGRAFRVDRLHRVPLPTVWAMHLVVRMERQIVRRVIAHPHFSIIGQAG
jgi:hypothetical protein